MSDLTEATRKAYQLRDPQEAMEIVHRTGPVSGFGLHADLTDTVRAQAELHRIFGTGGALQKGVSDIRALWLSSLASSYSLLNDAQAGAIVSAWKQAFGEDLDALPPDQVYKGNGRNVGDSASLLGVLMEVVTKASDSSKPYGNVTYADPGWQKDGKARYPLDSEQHIRAAWSYINQAKNAALYTAAQLGKIKAKIKAAMQKIGADVAGKSGAGDDGTAQTSASGKPDDPKDPKLKTPAAVGLLAKAKAKGEPHEYDGGKDGTGPCTSCGMSKSDGNHLPEPS